MLGVFAAYGGLSLYLNYYFHDFNRTTTTHLYVLHKRAINIPIVSSLLREGIMTGNRDYLIRTPGKTWVDAIGNPQSKVAEEQITDMFAIEAAVKEYEKYGSRDIFPRYFAMAKRLDTYEFCDLVDGFPTKLSASTACSSTACIECTAVYQGPRPQGLSGGMGYNIEFHNLYIVKALNTDRTNQTQLDALQKNPVYVSFGSPILHPYT